QWGEGGIVDTPIIRCDEASWRFLGLSFAGWNAVASAFLAAVAAFGASQKR
ncbi:MAG: disulfide bond formation protein B, partial [Methyloceanibacter sp.]